MIGEICGDGGGSVQKPHSMAKMLEGIKGQDGSFDETVDFAPIPDQKAAQYKFPPGCPVMVCCCTSTESGLDERKASKVLRRGVVQKVGINLEDKANRETLYKVQVQFHHALFDENTIHQIRTLFVEEHSLMFALGTPIWLTSLTPSGVKEKGLVVGLQHLRLLRGNSGVSYSIHSKDHSFEYHEVDSDRVTYRSDNVKLCKSLTQVHNSSETKEEEYKSTSALVKSPLEQRRNITPSQKLESGQSNGVADGNAWSETKTNIGHDEGIQKQGSISMARLQSNSGNLVGLKTTSPVEPIVSEQGKVRTLIVDEPRAGRSHISAPSATGDEYEYLRSQHDAHRGEATFQFQAANQHDNSHCQFTSLTRTHSSPSMSISEDEVESQEDQGTTKKVTATIASTRTRPSFKRVRFSSPLTNLMDDKADRETTNKVTIPPASLAPSLSPGKQNAPSLAFSESLEEGEILERTTKEGASISPGDAPSLVLSESIEEGEILELTPEERLSTANTGTTRPGPMYGNNQECRLVVHKRVRRADNSKQHAYPAYPSLISNTVRPERGHEKQGSHARTTAALPSSNQNHHLPRGYNARVHQGKNGKLEAMRHLMQQGRKEKSQSKETKTLGQAVQSSSNKAEKSGSKCQLSTNLRGSLLASRTGSGSGLPTPHCSMASMTSRIPRKRKLHTGSPVTTKTMRSHDSNDPANISSNAAMAVTATPNKSKKEAKKKRQYPVLFSPIVTEIPQKKSPTAGPYESKQNQDAAQTDCERWSPAPKHRPSRSQMAECSLFEPSPPIRRQSSDRATYSTHLKLPAYLAKSLYAIMKNDKCQALQLCDMHSCSVDFRHPAFSKSGDQSNEVVPVKLDGTDEPQLVKCCEAIEELLCRNLPESLRGFFLVSVGELNPYRAKKIGIIHTRNPSLLGEGETSTSGLCHMTVLRKSQGPFSDAAYKMKLQDAFPEAFIDLVESHHAFPAIPPHVLLSSVSFNDVYESLRLWEKWLEIEDQPIGS